MPLVTIIGSPRLSERELEEVSRQTHAALTAHYNVTQDDRFHVLIPGSTGARITVPPAYMGKSYSDRIVVIQIVANNTRTPAQKQALLNSLNERICAALDFRSDDIIICLQDVAPENSSFGIASVSTAQGVA